MSLWSFSPAAAQVPRPPPPGVQIITAEEIIDAGIARLSELFKLIDAWYATSVQGYSWDASANALGALGQPSWLLLVDGQVTDVRVLDAQNVNVLPLSLAQVDYVEVTNRPAWVGGLLAQHGVLHLHTRSPQAGASVQGGFAASNEIGDPGPYRYTSFASPNIDRIGPTFDAAASGAGTRWYARAHFKADEHHATDERIRTRVLALYLGEKQPRLLQTSFGLDLGADSRRLGRHRLFAGFTRLQDLRFFEPAGLEVPTDHYFYHAGLAGDFFPGDANGISYRLSYTVNDLDLRNNSGRLDFNWRQNAFRGHYEIRAATGPVSGALGLTADVFESFSGVDLSDATLAIPRAYARIGWDGDPRFRPELGAYLTRVEGEVGYGVLAGVAAEPVARQTLTITGSIVRQPYAAQNTLWFWTNRGYDFLRRVGADVVLPSDFAAATTFTADAAWRLRPSDRLAVTLMAGWRRFDDLTLADYRFAFDPVTTGFRAETTVFTNRSGQATTVGGEVRFRLVPSLEQRLHYAYVRYPTDNDTFFAAWRAQPWHRLHYTARFAPLPRLSLYARLTYFSETQWPAYFQAVAASDGRYEATLPGTWLLDLSAQKRFWKDHLALSLSLRNFLNQAHRTHPAGAVTNMALQVRVRAYLNGRLR